ncbi:MAG TPA: hypothetical protein VEV20_09210 [Burkholderiales bacterium]|nr:hypothetical protein [Burkholderiales bacterium]
MSLKPQDICVLLKIVALEGTPWSYSQLAYELGMSASEVHAGVKRAAEASLMRLEEGWGTPDPGALEELLVHGLKYVFAPVRGGLARGIPTSFAAPGLSALPGSDTLLARPDELPPVWPDDEGDVRGYEFSPLYKSVPFAARRDAKLYELLALVDAIRGGSTEEREAATRELRARLRDQPPDARVLSLVPRRGMATGSRAAATRIKRGSNGQEAQRVYRRRHRDS